MEIGKMARCARISLAFLLLSVLACPVAASEQENVIDIHHLPLGDGHVSGAPERGYVMSCMTNFRPLGPRSRTVEPWIHGDSWDLAQKATVQGRVMWPQAQFSITSGDNERVVSRMIEGNGLPVETPTGIFPISPDDPAFQFDGNPNSIVSQTISLTLPLNPSMAEEPSCVPMGMIGVALNGVAIFNALDDSGRDAVAHEVQDLCNGHPQRQGQYHYHGPSACLPNEADDETLIGYALDGFGIYSMYDAQGRELTDADLDECHGRTSVVMWNGRRQAVYHYVLTREYPYTIGCFRGTPVRLPHPFGRRRRGGFFLPFGASPPAGGPPLF